MGSKKAPAPAKNSKPPAAAAAAAAVVGELDIDSFFKSLPQQEDEQEEDSHNADKKQQKKTSGALSRFLSSSKRAKTTQPPVEEEEEEEEEEAEEEDEEDEEELHKQQLQELAQSDPEFYKALQHEAKDLLEFGQEDEEQDEQDDDQDEDEEEDAEAPSFSLPEILQLDQKSEKGDQVAIRRLIRIFRDAMLQPMDSLPDQEDIAVYEHLLRISLLSIARGLDLALHITKHNPLPKPNSVLAHPIRQLLACLTKLIASKHTSPSVLQHVLQTSRLFCSFFTSAVPVEGKKFTTTLINIWSRDETEGPVRLAAFFRLRQMCMLDRDELLSQALRDCYVAFARQAKSYKVDAVKERIGLQARCLVELYSIDRDAGYRVAFLHIRQLALHVRSALASKTAESLQSLCSWQFMHCLRLWGFVLQENDLNQLDFPLLQVALGVLSLFHGSNSTRYLPLQLHCIETINRLCASKHTYAPVGLLCVELLANLVHKKIVPSTDTMTPGDLQSILKFKAESAQHANVRLVVVPAVLQALRAHLVSHRTGVAFPELLQPIAKQLRAVHFTSGGDKKKKKGGSGSSDAWTLQAIKLRDQLLRDAEEWAKLVRDARQGGNPVLVPNPPSGPADVDKCDQFRATLAAHYASVDQQQQRKKDAAAADAGAGFATASKVSLVEPKANKAAVELVLGKKPTKKDAEEQDEDEEEGVGAFNPRDFM